MGDAVAHTVLTTVLEEECLVPDSPEKGRHEPTIVTVPAADFPTGSYVRSGTTYGEESENFFEEQYFTGHDLVEIFSAGSAVPCQLPHLKKLTICQMVRATVHGCSKTQPRTSQSFLRSNEGLCQG